MLDTLMFANPFFAFALVLLGVGLFTLAARAALDRLRELVRVHNLRTKARRQTRKTIDYLGAPQRPAVARSACPNCDTPTIKMLQGPRAPGGQNLCCAGCGAVYATDLDSYRVSADECIGYALVDAERRVTPRRTPTRTHHRWHEPAPTAAPSPKGAAHT